MNPGKKNQANSCAFYCASEWIYMYVRACVLYVCTADPIQKLFLIMTTGLLGFFLVKSQRDQLLFCLSTALDFNRPTLTQGGWAVSDGCRDVGWVWECMCGVGESAI